ncbi:tRNA lysidine(34) synthetase TilS [Escherichia coli]|nr:tRNA lysidine(34) synthetase TilS [Escherichia coli]
MHLYQNHHRHLSRLFQGKKVPRRAVFCPA